MKWVTAKTHVIFSGYIVHGVKIQSPDYEARGSWPEPPFSPHLPLRLQITSTCHPDLPYCPPHQGCSLPPVLCWLLPVSVPSLICSIDHFQLLPSTFSLQHWWLPHFFAPDCLNAEKFSSGDAALSASFKASDSKWFVPSKCNSLLWTLHRFLEGQFSGPIEPKSGKFPMTFSSWLLLRTLANLPKKKYIPSLT